MLTGADRERERQRGDEEHGRHDAPGALAHLARRVEARLPEDEHEQQDQEREPVRLFVQSSPQRTGFGSNEQRAQRERRVETEDQPADVDRREREDADDPTERAT